MESFDIDRLIQKWIEDGRPVKKGAPLPYEHGDNWPQDKLHVTDVGRCQRQVVLRVVRKAPMRPNTAVEDSMFDLANYMHWRANRALDHAGLLAYEEEPINIGEITGRSDAGRILENGKVRCIDWKTVHPNWVKKTDRGADNRVGDYPKEKDVQQVSIYRMAGVTGNADGWVDIGYLDRGGSNPSKYCAGINPTLGMTLMAMIHDLEETVAHARDDPDWLPDILQPYIKWGQRYFDRQGNYTGGEILYGPDWQCRYCRVINCPAMRENRVLGKMTKSRGLELTDIGRRMKGEIELFLELDAEGRALHE